MGSVDRIQLTLAFAEVAAGTGQTWYVPIAAPGTWLLKKAYFVSETARTANDTNFTDISLENGGTEIASEQTTTSDTGNLVAGTAIELALTGSGQDLEFDQGDSITIKKTEGGTGLALDGCFCFDLVNVVRN